MRYLALVVALLALPLTDVGGQVAVASTTATLTLTPESGDAPSVTGTLSGSGWCSPARTGYPRLTGRGVSGSVSLVPLRGGGALLTGEFTVQGSPGQSVEITVTNVCPPPPGTVALPDVTQSETATFRFNAATPTPAPFSPSATPTAAQIPPSPTPAPAVIPSATPTAALVPPGPSPTPTPAEPPPVGLGLVASATTTLTFSGCDPGASQVKLEFLPLVEAADGPEPPPATLVLAARKPGDEPSYQFDSPVADAGKVLGVKVDAGDCSSDDGAWVPGKDLTLVQPPPGSTSLEGCKYPNMLPCEEILVKGASVRRGEAIQEPAASAGAPEGPWVLELQYFEGDLKKRKQTFRWEFSLPGVEDVRLQASVLPFSTSLKDDDLSPAGLVASWDVHFDQDCGVCEFQVPLSALDTSPDKSKSVFDKAVDVIAAPFKFIGNGVKGIFGGGKKKGVETFQAAKPQIAKEKPGDYLVDGAGSALLQPTTYYFRTVPMIDGKAAGSPSNSVILQQVPKPPPVKISISPTPTPVVPAYEVKIIAYNGIIPPLNPAKDCYVVTEEAYNAGFGYFTTDPSKAIGSGSLKPGQLLCKPDPDEPDLFEVIVSWVESGVDWAAGAWQDIKNFAVQTVLEYTGLGALCDAVGQAAACQTAAKIALDAALVAAGIPPDIPNFSQALDQGAEYLAAQAAAQVGIPPDVVKAATEQGGPYAGLALEAAEAELREELQKELEAQLKKTVKDIQLGYASQVSWVPDGVPVRPDDYQPPGMTVRVTRKAGVPGGDQGCTFGVRDFVEVPAAIINSPPPGWESAIKGLTAPGLSPLIDYDFFLNEADLASGNPAGLDKQLYVPPLAAGEFYDIPMTFKPNYYKSGYSPLGVVPVNDYILAWTLMHEFGNLTMSVTGSCGATSLALPAKAITLAAQVVQ